MNNNVNAHANNDGLSNYKSDSNSQISDSMKMHFDILLAAFASAGKGLDSAATKEEIVDLLDSRTRNKRFDKTLINKLFTVIADDNRNAQYSVSVFIKNYIYLEEEMKQNMLKYEQLLAKEQTKNEEWAERRESALRSEIVNEEGLTEKSKITILFIEVIPYSAQNSNHQYETYVVQSKYLDQVQHTNEFSSHEACKLQQEFTFKLQTMKSEIEFVLFGKARNNNDGDGDDDDECVPLGNVRFPLEKLEKEESFNVNIKIPELHNEHNTILDINATLTCYWSDAFNFTEEKKISDEKLVKIKEKLNKTKFYLSALLEPLEYSNARIKHIRQNNADALEPIMEMKETNEVNTGDVFTNKESVCENKQLQLIENKIKETFNVDVVDWFHIVEMCAIIICLCSVLALYRNDYVGATGGCVIMCINRMMKGKNEAKQVMSMIKGTIGVAIGMAVMDVVWLVMNFVTVFKGVDDYKGGKENGILRVSALFCVCNIAVKGVVTVGGLIQYNKVSHMLKQNK